MEPIKNFYSSFYKRNISAFINKKEKDMFVTRVRHNEEEKLSWHYTYNGLKHRKECILKVHCNFSAKMDLFFRCLCGVA